MKRTKKNVVASRAALRRTVFALLLVSLLHSLVMPPRSFSAPAREVKAATSKANHASALPHGAATTQATEAYGKVSLTFEANEGQTDPQVKFLTRANGATVFLTATEAVFALAVPSTDAGGTTASKPLDKHERATATAPRQTAVLRMQIEGANAEPSVVGLEKQEGIVNYFVGSDPSQWHAGIPTYGRVEYAGVYPGVDVVYYGAGSQLEYDFVVQPGADASQVSLKFDGADDMQLDANGNLVIKTPAGEVRQQKPSVYQEADGARQEVECGYVLKGNGAVGFSLGAYDTSRPLIIDPVLAYSTYLGGSGSDAGLGIAVDSSGDAYVTGNTLSTNFPLANPVQNKNAGGSLGMDAFVTKLNASGSALIYSTYLGGNGDDQGNGIALDSSGNAYVAGNTASTDFPTVNAFQKNFGGGTSDAFVTKLNASGSALIYSTYLGGSGSQSETGNAIAVDSAGSAYVTGTTASTNFPLANAMQSTFGGVSDAYVTKFSASGSTLIYSTYLGGSSEDDGNGIALDSSGNAYVAGDTASTNFPVTANAFQKTSGGGGLDAFVTKLNANGSALTYSTYLGGSNLELANDIAVDSSGDAYA
ncbi:MAG TPA: SBBP repeat-containing protein, partial [Pyrinomonadaceae bacterium]|nr:SBBP repeat-containing protein [Pyrinomonadaceae bacterium]